MWRDLLVGLAVGLSAVWALLVVTLMRVRPQGASLAEAVRLLPDLVRLLTRVTRDPAMPSAVRWRIGLLLAYLALPIDLVPDFIPVLGQADDAIVVAWTLRSVVRRIGVPALRGHWPGTDDGFAALVRLAGLGR